MINYQPFYKIISDTSLKNWIVDAPKIIKKNLRKERYAHIEEWEESLNQIPEISPDFIDLKKSVRMEGRIDSDIEKKLMLLLLCNLIIQLIPMEFLKLKDQE